MLQQALTWRNPERQLANTALTGNVNAAGNTLEKARGAKRALLPDLRSPRSLAIGGQRQNIQGLLAI